MRGGLLCVWKLLASMINAVLFNSETYFKRDQPMGKCYVRHRLLNYTSILIMPKFTCICLKILSAFYVLHIYFDIIHTLFSIEVNILNAWVHNVCNICFQSMPIDYQADEIILNGRKGLNACTTINPFLHMLFLDCDIIFYF